MKCGRHFYLSHSAGDGQTSFHSSPYRLAELFHLESSEEVRRIPNNPFPTWTLHLVENTLRNLNFFLILFSHSAVSRHCQCGHSTMRYCDGGAASPWQDVHRTQAHTLPQLDWHRHKRLALKMQWILPQSKTFKVRIVYSSWGISLWPFIHTVSWLIRGHSELSSFIHTVSWRIRGHSELSSFMKNLDKTMGSFWTHFPSPRKYKT